MKNKILLPLLAVVLAMVGAFASSPMAQMGWYDSNGAPAGGGVQTSITIPGASPTCSTTATSHVCKIVVGLTEFNAYNSQANAENGGGNGTTGLLKYN